MANTFKYYFYDRYSFRIEFEHGVPVGGAVLKSNGKWMLFKYGWEIILKNSAPISEELALKLEEAKKTKVQGYELANIRFQIFPVMRKDLSRR